MSDTSSEANIKYEGDKNQSKITSDTDLFVNLLANPQKIKPEGKVELGPIEDDSTSKISDSDSDSDTRTSSSSRKSNKSVKSGNKTPEITPQIVLPMPKKEYNDTPKPIEEKKEVPLTEKEIKLKKIDMLRKLSELKSKGYELSKEYNFSSSLSEMEYEYELLKSYVDKSNGVKMYKNLLINGVALVEFFNEKYDPFEFQLQGWSEHMSVEVDSYDEVMEELYEKYRGSGRSMPPEIKLMFLVMASGAAFHYSKSTLGKAVGLGKPGMVANMMGKKPQTESRFMTQQEINLQNLRERDRLAREQSRQSVQGQMRAPSMRPQSLNMPAGVTPLPANGTQAPKVNIPNNVNNILQRLKTQREQNNRVVSETTINSSEMNTSERKRRGRKPKSVIHIDT